MIEQKKFIPTASSRKYVVREPAKNKNNIFKNVTFNIGNNFNISRGG